MLVSGASESTLRLDRLEISRLAWAFTLSIALHLLVWGTYAEGKKLHVWEKIRLPQWAKALTRPVSPNKPERPIQREAPLMFVDVSPHQATTESPKNAQFYSSRNSQAANPDADKNLDVPKISGEQTQVAKTEDVPRNQFNKLQPTAPAPRDQSAEQARPKPMTTPGDLALAKPDPSPRQGDGTAEQPRPRTLKEVAARQPVNQRPGQKMKQEGGVSRHLEFASLDAKATPFGAYDAAFIEAVQQRWDDLLDNMSYAGYRRGKVVLQFHLNYDGRITEMKIVGNTVGEMLGLMCQKAVQDPAPFEKWPREMRLMVGEDFREIQFTFYYN